MPSSSEQPVIDALYRISRTVHLAAGPREGLEMIIDEIMGVLSADSAAIEVINPDTNCLEMEVSRGFRKELTGTPLKVGAGLTGWVALHGKPANVPEVDSDPRYLRIDPDVRSEMAAPVSMENGEVMGVVSVSSYRAQAFSDSHEKVLVLLTAEATRALNHLWLIEQLREKADHLEVLIDIARSIAAKRDLEEILSTITRRTLEIPPGKLCALFLRELDNEHLALKACSSLSGARDYTETIALDESAIGTAFRRNLTIEVPDLPKTEEHHFRQAIRDEGLVSMLACPVRFEREVIGVLNIYTDQPHRFSDAEKRLFESLASLSATAIRNAELYERIFQSEENLRRSERLTTLGLLSAEIAHEIRNPLTVIQLLFESLTMDFSPADPRNRDVRIISEKLVQLDAIVARVLSFGKSQQEFRSHYNLNRLIEDTLHLVRLKLKQSRIELGFTRHRGVSLLVDVNKGQIQQALLNVLINAMQAMPAGGRIDIFTTIEGVGRQESAVVRIRDTGKGIDPAKQAVIFDSFLSGRPGGTGLGLSIVKRILKSHHGTVAVEQSGPEGTVMRLSLPLARRPD